MNTVLERGDVFFFYRPRVDRTEVHDLSEVQRFFVVLEPDDSRRFRRIVVGKKRLPDPDSHEREWAIVVEVADRPEEIVDDIEPKTYETRRGDRELPAARPAGEGRYALVEHDDHTHFAYALELPQHPRDVQRDFGIRREASYIVAIMKPDTPDFPREVLERFRNRRFIPANPPSLLDHEGIQVVLIGAAGDPARELGIQLDPESERLEDADLVEDLRLRLEELPIEPLVKGKWR